MQVYPDSMPRVTASIRILGPNRMSNQDLWPSFVLQICLAGLSPAWCILVWNSPIKLCLCGCANNCITATGSCLLKVLVQETDLVEWRFVKKCKFKVFYTDVRLIHDREPSFRSCRTRLNKAQAYRGSTDDCVLLVSTSFPPLSAWADAPVLEEFRDLRTLNDYNLNLPNSLAAIW